METPQVLDVDDCAIHKGSTYGTILVDLGRGHPIDLLPDRDPETLSNWLQQHPGIEIVPRDWAPEHIRAINDGSPSAHQAHQSPFDTKSAKQMAQVCAHTSAWVKRFGDAWLLTFTESLFA